jgi:CHAT domain-containing protein
MPLSSYQSATTLIFQRHLQEHRAARPLFALRQDHQTIKAKYPQPFFWAVFILHGEG